jgi:PBP1b-binding outer membrane lipoprotein LpoB
MKKLLFIAGLALVLVACGGDHRDAKDQTDPKEENISPNQTITEEERAKKDSTDTDILPGDTTSAEIDRNPDKPSN